jgi:hypothetical protein
VTLVYRTRSCNHELLDIDWYKSWYGITNKSSRKVAKYFFDIGLRENHNPSPFVNTSWLKRNLEGIQIEELICNPCNYSQVKTHPLIDPELQVNFCTTDEKYHHGSLNINEWITATSNIKHKMFLQKKTVLSPLEFQHNSNSDFYPIAGNCLEYENRIIFDHGPWDLKFIVEHLKYSPQLG